MGCDSFCLKLFKKSLNIVFLCIHAFSWFMFFLIFTSKLHHKKEAYSASFFCRSMSSLIRSFRYLLTLSFVSRYSRMSASCFRWSLNVLILYVLSLHFWFALFRASDTVMCSIFSYADIIHLTSGSSMISPSSQTRIKSLPR